MAAGRRRPASSKPKPAKRADLIAGPLGPLFSAAEARRRGRAYLAERRKSRPKG